MSLQKYLLLFTPNDWTNDAKGQFFESFIASMLEPMRLTVIKRIRVTGMEIDLLARDQDQPRTILIECKAYRDPLPSDVITKLLGNVTIRKADAGWLFSTAELGKDAQGLNDEIKSEVEMARKFAFYPPSRIIDILIGQHSIISPETFANKFPGMTTGAATLIISPTGWSWLFELTASDIPTHYAAFNARTGAPLSEAAAKEMSATNPRFAALVPFIPQAKEAEPKNQTRAPAARVLSGDGWDDLRPARPIDFVGRDDLISEIDDFLQLIRTNKTPTRTFAIEGPSGWGKSSLVLKLADRARRGDMPGISFTGVDTRSAINCSFVCEALRAALEDAAEPLGLNPSIRIDNLSHPLDSTSAQSTFRAAEKKNFVIALVFDQFEELFSKEDLFEVFSAVRELCLEADARQLPLALGFAWKTDIALPQLHPAYHLWHQLSDRRRGFRIREFGKRDIEKVISTTEKAAKKRLSPPLRARLIEQCQGLPWLLKKLLVHVFNRVASIESQYALLERELDIEHLFKEDLQTLSNTQLKCLEFVARRAPVAVSEVESSFSRECTNALIERRLLVRSGMNYVVYWDIFRDYLLDKKVPHIPWARMLNTAPTSAMRVLPALKLLGKASTAMLAKQVGFKERPCLNLLSDLVALQLVDRVGSDHYALGSHIQDVTEYSIAKHVQGQLQRHLIHQKLLKHWEAGKTISVELWEDFFRDSHPRIAGFSKKTIHQYASNFKRWATFSGLIAEVDRKIVKPSNSLTAMGRFQSFRGRKGTFLGTSTPENVLQLLEQLRTAGQPVSQEPLELAGLRNAVLDAVALSLVEHPKSRHVALRKSLSNAADFTELLRTAILHQDTIRQIADAADCNCSVAEIGTVLMKAQGRHWKNISAQRYASGLLRFRDWALSCMPIQPESVRPPIKK